MTSTSYAAPGVVNETGWNIQNYRKDYYPRNESVVLTDPDNELVRARHIAVYNNGTSGVSLSEFEAFGIGMYLDRTIHRKF